MVFFFLWENHIAVPQPNLYLLAKPPTRPFKDFPTFTLIRISNQIGLELQQNEFSKNANDLPAFMLLTFLKMFA